MSAFVGPSAKSFLKTNLIISLLIFLLTTSALSQEDEISNETGDPTLTEESERVYPGDECDRECVPGDVRICEYEWEVTYFWSLLYGENLPCGNCPFNETDCEADSCVPFNGLRRAMVTVNRQFPGPAVVVCRGDTIRVRLTNNLEDMTGVTIHWHGAHQRGTPGMDGPVMITQCPIPHATTFVYNFEAEPAGTFFWHSHIASHRADGLAGALVVRQSLSEDPSAQMYDEDLTEHIVFLQEGNMEMQNPMYPEYLFSSGVAMPDFLTVNGRGRHTGYKDISGKDTFVPLSTIFVSQGTRYRFRVISNGYTQCRIKLSIDKHRLVVIAMDGYAVEPVEFDSLIISGGERYDFVLNANQPIENYWLRVQGVGTTVCNFAEGVCCEDFVEFGILRYDGAPKQEPVQQEMNNDDEITLNSHFHDEGDNFVEISTLTSLVPYDSPTGERTTYYLSVGVNTPRKDSHIRNGLPQINRVTFVYPPGPVLTQSREMEESAFCQAGNYREECEEELCACTQYIDAQYNETVELFFFNSGSNPEYCHPVHIHGFSLRLVARGKLEPGYYNPTILEQMDREGMFPRISPAETTPVKDTICVGGSTYVILEFVADNVGWWFVHCHLDYDMMLGMAMVIKVGTDEQIEELIPENFPRCGSYSVLDP